MTVLDWTLVAILGFFLIRGLFRGFLLELFEVIVLVAGYMAARYFGPPLGGFVTNLTGMSYFLAGSLAFVIIFVTVAIGLGYVALMLRKAVRAAQLGWLDRSGGALLALLKSGIIILIALLLFSFLPLSAKTVDYIAGGPVAGKAWFIVNIIQSRLHLAPATGGDQQEINLVDIQLPDNLPGKLEEDVQKAVLILTPGASTQRMADCLRSWGLNEEIVHIITDNVDVMKAILLQTPESSELPVENIAKGEAGFKMPDKLGLSEQRQEQIVTMLENQGLNPEEKGAKFWEMVHRE